MPLIIFVRDVLFILVYEVTLPAKHVLEKINYQKTTSQKASIIFGFRSTDFYDETILILPT